MTRKLALVPLLLANLGMDLARAGEARAPGAAVVLRRCEIEYKRSTLVGVAHMGTSASILQDCYVHPGDRVKVGQVLGRVMDRDIRAEVELRTVEAENDLDVRLGETKSAQAINTLMRSEVLVKRNSYYVSKEELIGQELDVAASKLKIEQSQYARRLAAIQRRQAETLLKAREFVCPHDGVVVEVHKEQGEAVAMGEPIFRVVDVDSLKVTGYLNLHDFWRVKPGQKVRISPEIDGEELPIESEVFTGRIVFVDRRIDPTSRTCKVVAEVVNRDLLLASGLEARMEISLEEEPADVSAAGSPERAASLLSPEQVRQSRQADILSKPEVSRP